MENKKEITVGSRAFFSCYDDFEPHDNDLLRIIDEPKDFKECRYIRLLGNCYIEWKRMTPSQYIEYHDKHRDGISLGKFLVKEFVDDIGFSIDDLRRLRFLVEILDERHLYQKVIYDAYIENGGFFMTEEQRNMAYEEYKRERKNKTNRT